MVLKNIQFRTSRPLLHARKSSFSPKNFLGLGGVFFFLITLLYGLYTAIFVPASSALRDMSAPLLRFSSALAEETGAFFDHVYHLIDLSQENADLKRGKQEDQKWQILAEHLKAENLALRDMLNMVQESDYTFLTAKVFAYPAAVDAEQKIMIRGGKKEGMTLGQPVFFEKYMIGRIVKVKDNTAEVLLLTDGASKIPVKTASGARGLLKGHALQNMMRLEYTEPDAKIGVGDTLVTSADGGLVDSGYLLGSIAALKDGAIFVRAPYDDVRKMTYVQVIAPSH